MHRLQILIVEDEFIVAEHIRRKLKGMGYPVTGIASSGEQAIQTALATRPDLVLMDIRLAGKMDGIEAAAQIHAQLDVPVIYLTAHADDAVLQQVQADPSFGCVSKPFHERELEHHLETTFQAHRQAQQAGLTPGNNRKGSQ